MTRDTVDLDCLFRYHSLDDSSIILSVTVYVVWPDPDFLSIWVSIVYYLPVVAAPFPADSARLARTATLNNRLHLSSGNRRVDAFYEVKCTSHTRVPHGVVSLLTMSSMFSLSVATHMAAGMAAVISHRCGTRVRASALLLSDSTKDTCTCSPHSSTKDVTKLIRCQNKVEFLHDSVQLCHVDVCRIILSEPAGVSYDATVTFYHNTKGQGSGVYPHPGFASRHVPSSSNWVIFSDFTFCLLKNRSYMVITDHLVPT
ncbi:hypothetical protein E2C01_023657 [Portunus trituberculatus]|uniref:Uncharacterized protein n=1 Tax=Portunus trituberculatus TaxID=210409 RepID=A0A5B7EC64_PORTR|nr:hypothetical protein [Portunus trituberculatus]